LGINNYGGLVKKTALEIYALAVCFFTVVCFAISLGIAMYDAVELSSPEFALSSWEYERHQSNEAFKQRRFGCGSDDKENDLEKLSEDELTKRREQSYTLALKNERHDAVQSLVQTGIIMFIDAFIFLVHWLLALRARQSAAATG